MLADVWGWGLTYTIIRNMCESTDLNRSSCVSSIFSHSHIHIRTFSYHISHIGGVRRGGGLRYYQPDRPKLCIKRLMHTQSASCILISMLTYLWGYSPKFCLKRSIQTYLPYLPYLHKYAIICLYLTCSLSCPICHTSYLIRGYGRMTFRRIQNPV